MPAWLRYREYTVVHVLNHSHLHLSPVSRLHILLIGEQPNHNPCLAHLAMVMLSTCSEALLTAMDGL
jgi:hypothetical protein